MSGAGQVDLPLIDGMGVRQRDAFSVLGKEGLSAVEMDRIVGVTKVGNQIGDVCF